MVNYWIFQNRKDERYERDIDKWRYYKANKKWLFDKNSPNVLNVESKDKVLLRIFDEGFGGKFEVASSWEEDKSMDGGNPGWIKIDNIELWEPPLPRNFVVEQLSNKQYRHAIIQITERDFICIEACQKLYKKLGFGSRGEKDIIILEKGVEKALIQNLDSLGLQMVEHGEQMVMGSGRCDLLCKDSDNNFVVIEIKRGTETGDEVVGQCLRYVGFIKDTMAEKNQKVRGIIITGGYNDDIEWAIKGLPKGLVRTRIFRLPY